MQALHFGLFLMGVVLIKESLGACFRDTLKTGYLNGEHIEMCRYKGYPLLIGETGTLPAPDCIKCSCNSDGLSCCGYGSALMGVISIPGNSKCVPIKDGCDIKWVYRDNEDKECSKQDRKF